MEVETKICNTQISKTAQYKKLQYHRRMNQKIIYSDHKICLACGLNLSIENFNLKCVQNGERDNRCAECVYEIRSAEERFRNQNSQ